VKLGVLLALATLLLATAGCEPGYHAGRSSGMGGYDSERKDFNVFHVWYSGNSSVPEEKASDLALLRAAEVTLEHGFNYLAVMAAETEMTPVGKPLAQLVIACFRNEPSHVRSYDTYEAAALFQGIVERYDLKHHGVPIEAERGSFKPAPEAIQFHVEPWYTNEPIPVEDVEYVIMGIENLDMDGTWVGRFADLENPVETIKDFVGAARPLAARYGANALVVEADPARIHGNMRFNDIEQNLIGFVADLYVVPEASLGIEWEPGDMLLGKYIIRRFRSGSKAAEAGLRLGDKVLAINGVDVLDTSRLLQQTMKWSVGEKVRLTVVRDGRETIIEVPLVPNIIVSH